MASEFIVIITLIIAGFLVLAYFLRKWLAEFFEKQKPSDDLVEIVKMLQSGSKEDRKVLLETLQKNTQALNERLDSAARVISKVQKNVGEMSEIGRGMKEIQEFLQSPKLRGNIGEQVLKELLSQILPKQSFHLQYTFKSGQTVDAAVKTSNGIIPIDSKFPLENFRKMASCESSKEKERLRKTFINDVRRHIRDISSKYIVSDEGTIDYALMYIPSESVYYEVVNEPDIFDYSGKRRVLPVSPTTFYAYMRAILISFEGQKIEERARQILTSLRAIQKDYQKVEDNLGVLGKHVNNAYNMMSNVITSFSQLGHKISNTQALGEEEEEDKKQLEG